MTPQELANFLGLETTQELAQRMIQEAMRLSKVVISKTDYTRKELGNLGRAVSMVILGFDNFDEGRTYQRFWDGEQFENTKVLNRLCAYILHMRGKIQYKPGPAEPGNNHWFMYCRYATGQPIHEPANEDAPPPPVIFTKKYRAYFFSHIRYNVWENGTIEMRYETENSGTVSGMGFYTNDDDIFEGRFEIRGNYVCMDLQGRSNLNWFRLIAKIEGKKMNAASFFRAAYISISSYANRYISAIEIMLMEETYAAKKPLEVEKVKRYLMLQRHRFQSDIWAPSAPLEILPSKLEPNKLAGMIGMYACVCRIHHHILVSSLVINEIYRTTFETKIYRKSGQEKNYQLCYLELIPTGAPDYIHIKGYLATEDPDEPTLKHLCSTLTIPMTVHDSPIRGTFNSLVELDGKEILWAGDCYFIKLDGKVAIKPFMCQVESLDQHLEPLDEVLSGRIRTIISH
jgi:hypothetical protein